MKRQNKTKYPLKKPIWAHFGHDWTKKKILKNGEYDKEIKGQSSFNLDVSWYFTFFEINSSAAINIIFALLEPCLYLHAPPSALSDCFISVGWSHCAQRNHKCYSAQVLTEHKIPSFFFFPSPPHCHHYVNHCHRGAHHSQHHYLKSFCPTLLWIYWQLTPANVSQ